MHDLSPIGIVLYMILSIVGGGLTGLFAGYMFFALRKEFSLLITTLINIVFYIVPVWAVFRLFDPEESLIFYLGLLISYFGGAAYSRKVCSQAGDTSHHYSPPDED